MRTFLLSTLLAFGIGGAGIVSAFAMVAPGILNATPANFSPRLQQVTHQCRAATKCDKDGKNCQTYDVCH
jgi:hypothetical protein